MTKNRFCWQCYELLWEVYRESSHYPKEIRQELKKLENLEIKNDSSDKFLAMFKGYEILNDKQKMTQLKKEIKQSYPHSKALEYLAELDYVDILRGSSTLSPIDFINQYPQSPQKPFLFRMELSKRVVEAKKDSKKKREVTELVKRWIDEIPESFEGYYLAGKAFQTLGMKKRKIKRYYEKALKKIKQEQKKIDPNYKDSFQLYYSNKQAQILTDLAWQEYLLGNKKTSWKIIQSISNNPLDNAKFYYYKGKIALSRGYNEQAENFLIQSLESGMEPEKILEDLRIIRKNPTYNIEMLKQELQNKSDIPIFLDKTKELGLEGKKGSWVSWGDFDGDGDPDLFIGELGLFKNIVGKDGKRKFINVWEKVKPFSLNSFYGGLWGDVDHDGDLDLFLMNGKNKNGLSYDRLLINKWKQEAKFIDESSRFFGGKVLSLKNSPSAAASWGQLDRDGWLDLYVAKYEKPGNPLGRGNQDYLFKNNGGKGFKNVCPQAGCQSSEPMCGRGVVWGDYDNDGDQDIFVANYRLDPNFFFENQGNGKLKEKSQSLQIRGLGVEGFFGHSIGAEFGDLDNDGDLDLVVANLAHPRGLTYSDMTAIYMNDLANNVFVNNFESSGIEYQETHSDPSLGDLDNDGDLDLILTAIYPGKPLTVYKNLGNGTFKNITFSSGINMQNSWGSALADFDLDGDLDLAVGSSDGVRIFLNVSKQNHWLHIEPIDRRTKGIVIGARVTVLSEGGRRQIREVQGGKGTGNQHSLPVEFGFGKNDQPVDVLVRFPNGDVVSKENVRLNQRLKIYSLK